MESRSAYVYKMTHKVKQNSVLFPVDRNLASLSITVDPESGRGKV